MDKQQRKHEKLVGKDSLQDNAGPLFMTPEVLDMTPKRSHKKRNLIISLVVTLLLIPAVIWAVYWFATPQKATTQPPKVVVADSAESIINKVNAKLTDTSHSDYRKAAINQTTPLSDTPAIGPSYKVSGADYYVATTDTYSLSITKQGTTIESPVDEDFNQTIADQIVQVLRDSKYKMTDTTNIVNYESATVVCTILAEGSPITVTCANKSTYNKISSDLKPFVQAHIAATSSDDELRTTYSNLKVTNSLTPKYQHASVSITQGMTGAVLLFYRHDEGTWKFFTGTQNILSCDEYNTIDLIAAYKGEKCIDGATETTVGAQPFLNSPQNPAQPANTEE